MKNKKTDILNLLPTGETILFVRLYNKTNQALIVKRNGTIIIFDMVKGQIINKIRLIAGKILGAELNDKSLIIIDNFGELISVYVPSLIIDETYSLIGSVQNDKPIELRDYKIINKDIVLLLSKEHLFICKRGSRNVRIISSSHDVSQKNKLGVSFGQFAFFLESDIEEEILIFSTGGYIISINIQDKEAGQDTIQINPEIQLDVPDKFSDYKKIFSGCVRVFKQEKPIILSVFVNTNGSVLYIINNKEMVLISLRFEVLTAGFTKNGTTILGLVNGGIFYFKTDDIRDIETYEYSDVTDFALDSILTSNIGTYLADRNGGLCKFNNNVINPETLFKSRPYDRMRVKPDIKNNSIFMLRNKNGQVDIIDHVALKRVLKFENEKLSYFKTIVSLEYIERRAVFFSNDATSLIINFNGKKSKDSHGWVGVTVQDIRKFGLYYYMTTKDGSLIKLSNNFEKIESNKIARDSIIEQEFYNYGEDILLVYTTNKGHTGVYSLKNKKRVISDISTNSVNITNSLLISRGELQFLTASKTGINIYSMKTGRIYIKLDFDNNKHALKFFNIPNNNGSIAVLMNDYAIYQINVDTISKNQTIELKEDMIVHKTLPGCESSLIRISKNRKNIFIPDPYGVTEVLTFNDIAPVSYNSSSNILSGFEYSENELVLSTGYGELIFIDNLNNQILKTDDIEDWFLEFIRYSDTNIAGFSYNGYFYNFISDKQTVNYVKNEVNAGKIYSADYSFKKEKFFLLTENGLIHFDHFSNTSHIINNGIIGNKIFVDEDSLIIFDCRNKILICNMEGFILYEESIIDTFSSPIAFDKYYDLYAVAYSETKQSDRAIVFKIDKKNMVNVLVTIKENIITGIWFDKDHFFISTGKGMVEKYNLSGKLKERILTGIDEIDHSINTGNNLIHSNDKNFILYKNNFFTKRSIYKDDDLIHFTERELQGKSDKIRRIFR